LTLIVKLSQIVQYGQDKYWEVIKNRTRPPAVIRVILRVHNQNSQKIKELISFYIYIKHCSLNFEKSNNCTRLDETIFQHQAI
jgi:hypothetical protein